MNGNSRSYTKDTDMQFARELAKGFGGGRADAKRSSAPSADSRPAKPRSENFGEKFGNPRPARAGAANRGFSNAPNKNGGDSAPRRPQGDGARRSRDFA